MAKVKSDPARESETDSGALRNAPQQRQFLYLFLHFAISALPPPIQLSLQISMILNVN
jgi:hypothetical protein